MAWDITPSWSQIKVLGEMSADYGEVVMLLAMLAPIFPTLNSTHPQSEY